MAQRVGDQVGDDLADTLGIGINRPQAGVQVQLQDLVLALGLEVKAGDDAAQQIGQVGRLTLQLQLASLGLGQGAQIIHQPRQHKRLFLQRSEGIWRRFEHAIQQGLQVTADDRQRRAQFVGDIGHHVAPQHLLPCYRSGHLVKCLAQLADLVLAVHLHLRRLALGQAMGSLGQRPERSRQLPRQPQAKRQSQHGGGKPGPDQ